MYLQFWFYLSLCKTKIFLSSSPHSDGSSYADQLKNAHAGNWPWGYSQGKSTLKLNSSAYEKYEYGHLGCWYIKLTLFKRF